MKEPMSHNAWEQLVRVESAKEQAEFQQFVQEGGYTAFHLLLEGFKQKLRQVRDDEIELVFHWIDKAQRLFPEPGVFSPSWIGIWNELKQIANIKLNIMQTIPSEQRSGEWQVIIDNPLTVHEIVCHPALSFDEASYIYSYFRPGLEKNEYIRLQKIQCLITDVGN
jgi:hypothetical protein